MITPDEKIVTTIPYSGLFPSLKRYVPEFLKGHWADAGSVIKKTNSFINFIITLQQDYIKAGTPSILPRCAGDVMTIPNWS